MSIATGDGGLPAAGQTSANSTDEAGRSRRSRAMRGVRPTLRDIGQPNVRALNDNRLQRLQRIAQRRAAEQASLNADAGRVIIPTTATAIGPRGGRRRPTTARRRN